MKDQIGKFRKVIFLSTLFTLITIACVVLIRYVYSYIDVMTLLIGIPAVILIVMVLFDLILISIRKYKRGKCIFELYSLGHKTESLKIIPLVLLILSALNVLGTKSYIKIILTVVALFMAIFLANRLWMKTICICEEGIYSFGEFYRWNEVVCYKSDENKINFKVIKKKNIHDLELEYNRSEKEKIDYYISEKGIRYI